MTDRPCECNGPGWCERHLMHKGPSMYKQCQVRKDYRDLWDSESLKKRLESGEIKLEDIENSPEVQKLAEEYEGASRGLGDTVQKFLKSVGITKKRTESVIQVVTGQSGGCGCQKRQEKLNEIFPYKNKDGDEK